MPGGRLRPFRLGDRSELLVEQLLAAFSFTSRVPRQEDFGLDFFCSLTRQEGQFLKAGPFFAVQAKSTDDDIVYAKPHELEWIRNQENPLLICVADRNSLAMDIYSTWNLLCGVLNGWRGQRPATRIVLRPGVAHHMWPWVEDNDDGSQEIRLGKPIARVTDAEIFDETRMELLANTIGQWVALDRVNIVNRHANMHWVQAPLAYETNQCPPSPVGVVFYCHPASLQSDGTNLGRAATSLIFTIGNTNAGIDTTQPPWSTRLSDLRAVLLSHWALLDEPVRQFLTARGITP
jgi:Domain of unknown function (DUF4365)